MSRVGLAARVNLLLQRQTSRPCGDLTDRPRLYDLCSCCPDSLLLGESSRKRRNYERFRCTELLGRLNRMARLKSGSDKCVLFFGCGPQSKLPTMCSTHFGSPALSTRLEAAVTLVLCCIGSVVTLKTTVTNLPLIYLRFCALHSVLFEPPLLYVLSPALLFPFAAL